LTQPQTELELKTGILMDNKALLVPIARCGWGQVELVVKIFLLLSMLLLLL